MPRNDYALLAPIKAEKPRTIEHMVAIDCEDDTHGNLRLACVYGSYLIEKHGHKKEVAEVEETFYDRAALNKFLLNLKTPKQDFTPCYLVGFNVGYDIAYFDESVDYETVLFAGTRFIAGELKNGIKIIDVFNHGGGKNLESWIDQLKMGEKGIVKTEFKPNMSLKELEEHCRNDVRAHWELANFFRETYTEIGTSFKSTTPATALDLFKRKFHHDIWRRKKAKYNDYERNAYYGGRTECFVRGKHRVKSYDINSAYVSVMANEYYPKPDTARRQIGSKRFLYYYKERENLMIVHCTVFAPKSRVMVLPYRDKKNGKLIFPYGKFTGWWCSPELHEAEKYGYKILKVHEYILYRGKQKFFETYANFTWNQRHEAAAAGNDGMKTVWKLFGNALYGKLAQRNPIGGHFSPIEPLVNDGTRPLMHIAADGKIWYALHASGKEDSINSFPCISAFITCYTRLKLLEYLKRHEKTVIYCDTDSIKVPWGDADEISNSELGGVKYEAEYSGWYCFIKPKLYGKVPKCFVDLPPNYDFNTPIPGFCPYVMSNRDDKWKIKGVGKYSLGYFDLDALEFVAEYQRPHRFKESVRRGLVQNAWVTLTKRLTLLDDKRIWKHQDSEPLKVIESEPLLT